MHGWIVKYLSTTFDNQLKGEFNTDIIIHRSQLRQYLLRTLRSISLSSVILGLYFLSLSLGFHNSCSQITGTKQGNLPILSNRQPLSLLLIKLY